LEEVRHLIIYHLGGNGNTVAVRDRLLLLEADVKSNRKMGSEVQAVLTYLTELAERRDEPTAGPVRDESTSS